MLIYSIKVNSDLGNFAMQTMCALSCLPSPWLSCPLASAHLLLLAQGSFPNCNDSIMLLKFRMCGESDP